MHRTIAIAAAAGDLPAVDIDEADLARYVRVPPAGGTNQISKTGVSKEAGYDFLSGAEDRCIMDDWRTALCPGRDDSATVLLL